MEKYDYLIIGAGMTADAAVRGIRELDSHGTIALIGSEADPPYDRPPLTKGLWKGKPLEKIWRRTEERNVTLHLGKTVVSLDPESRTVQDTAGQLYAGERLLLATGGTPKRLDFGGDEIVYFRTLQDYRSLRALTERGPRHFAVIGGGFIGSELAAALSMRGQRVTMLFPEHGIGGESFPGDLSDFVTDYYRGKSVEVLSGETATGLARRQDRLALSTDRHRQLSVDSVVAGIGIMPNDGLAEKAGLSVDDGILVDEFLAAGKAGIYAAGDVARFFSPALGHRTRVEHEDNANSMGRQAGRNMAGAAEAYLHLPYFYSDLFELGYEAVGDLDARMETYADWSDEFRKGVVYYFLEGRIKGILLWNVWDTVPKARQLIGQPAPFPRDSLRGWLP